MNEEEEEEEEKEGLRGGFEVKFQHLSADALSRAL